MTLSQIRTSDMAPYDSVSLNDKLKPCFKKNEGEVLEEMLSQQKQKTIY